ncbi:SNF2 family domain/helicase [Pseudoxanthomonas mexicana]|nr:SNF2 family domain/helicase [Pseudoxanthomonas mexicana]
MLAWTRLTSSARDIDDSAIARRNVLEVSWPTALTLIRTLAPLQRSLGFLFETDASSDARVKQFMVDYRAVRDAGTRSQIIAPEDIQPALTAMGWNEEDHGLKPYQAANLSALLSLRNGANFSVPGAGKTTVTFALHLLSRDQADRILVAAPKNAFPAWEEIIDECLLPTASGELRAPFQTLTGGEARIRESLQAGGKRFLISYDQLVRVDSLIGHYLATRAVHLVLDESHRMKAGYTSLRGASLLRMGHLAIRRDILTGTPMPQSSSDMQSQLDFLWPGAGLGFRISRGEEPRKVMDGLYVRTTKSDLQLPERKRVFVPVTISDAHCAFYAVLRDDLRAQASKLYRGTSAKALIATRRSVVRLLQAAVNPALVAQSLDEVASPEKSGLLRAVLQEGATERVRQSAALAERLVAQGKKVLLWTIFTSTVHQLRDLLSHLNPALIYGQIDMGDEDDDESRQGQLRRFKTDPNCHVMIANPAAAAEGISLHLQCHDAIYVDRSYNATHFLQSIDRIHRLGLPDEVDTTIYVMQNRLPSGIGSIDVSVSRRLGQKIRNMEKLLDDRDLHELALDEENAPLSIADELDARDIDDIVAEIENRAPQLSDEEAV